MFSKSFSAITQKTYNKRIMKLVAAIYKCIQELSRIVYVLSLDMKNTEWSVSGCVPAGDYSS